MDLFRQFRYIDIYIHIAAQKVSNFFHPGLMFGGIGATIRNFLVRTFEQTNKNKKDSKPGSAR
jgi:hypothetical protein